ncbi:MAG: STAS domain-containing protein [Anaerolineae bacterium]
MITKQFFKANVRYGNNGSAILDLEGELTAPAQDELYTTYTEIEKQNPHTILLNFSGIHYLNSTGIAMLINLLMRARRANIALMAYGLSRHYTELFQLAGLASVLPILPEQPAILLPVMVN